ncbi:MAG: hypothetical protein N2037_03330 [Acidimicrobiales bacterium]|nr:hypothetical protein [Acidimicrobiales bacterium]
MIPVPWRRLLAAAFLSTAVCLAALAWNYRSTYDYMGGLVDAAPDAAGINLMNHDFPDGSQSKQGGNHDGAFFYAIARDVTDPLTAARSLDRPRYRLQRILFPLMARAIYPVGVGEGLVGSLLVVGTLGVFGGAVAMGVLAATLRGPWWLGALFPFFTGSMLSLRISTPDPLAVALALGAIAASLRSQHHTAVALGILAVLTKETSLLLLVGFATWRRDRPGLWLAVGPSIAVASWFAFLHALELPPGREPEVIEFGPPFAGWLDAVRFWANVPSNRDETLWYLGAFNIWTATLLGITSVAWRGLRHPLAWPIVTQLVLLVFLTWIPLAPERNGTRTVLPLLALSVVTICTPGVERPSFISVALPSSSAKS